MTPATYFGGGGGLEGWEEHNSLTPDVQYKYYLHAFIGLVLEYSILLVVQHLYFRIIMKKK